MGHLGLTPQHVHRLGGMRRQGRDAKAASELIADALALQDAGCFAIVLEAIPDALAKQVTSQLTNSHDWDRGRPVLRRTGVSQL